MATKKNILNELRTLVKQIIKEEESKKWWIIGKDTRGGTLYLTDLLYNSKEEAEKHLNTIDIKSPNFRHLDINSIKVEPVSSGPNWGALMDTF